MKKLVIYGDSILRGITYSEQMGRHKLCAGYDLKTISDIGYEVKNRARMGATIVRGMDILESTLDECGENAVVLFEFGGNDCDHDWHAVSEHPNETNLPRIDEKTFVSCYKDAIAKARASGATVVMANMIPIDAERYMQTISRSNSYDNILSWLGDPSMLYRFQEHYNRIVERLAAEVGCPMIDLRGAFLLSHDYKALISADGIHPTEAGHDLIEKSLREFLSTQGEKLLRA
jgi:lysophospholipase L1-like esterase